MSHKLQKGTGHHPKKEPDRLQKPKEKREDKSAPHPEPKWRRENFKSPNATGRHEGGTIKQKD